MKCPACSNILVRRTYKTILVDYCSRCRGIWFDDGEFPEAANLLKESDSIQPAKTTLFRRRNVQTAYSLIEQQRFCPKCAKKLVKFNYSSDSNVFLDKCPHCGGIWADAGEVQRAAMYLKDDPKTTAVGKGLAELQEPYNDDWDDKMPYLPVPPRMILPISDDVELEKTPVVTISIIVMCCLVFAGQLFLFGDFEYFVKMFGFVPANFWSIGLFTSMFLHADIVHLAGNMFFLRTFGDNVEDRFTRTGYLVFFILCGLFGVVLHGVFNLGSSTPAIGASGAIAGVMGAYIVFYPRATITVWAGFHTFEQSAFFYLGGWFVFQLIAGSLLSGDEVSGVGWFAHIGGFVLGTAIAFLRKKPDSE